jgi:RNA polymerase-interacting CarD/CdnL/TRCF family regulator
MANEVSRIDIDNLQERIDRQRSEIFQAIEKYAVESRAADERLRGHIAKCSELIADLTRRAENNVRPCPEMRFLQETVARHINEHDARTGDWRSGFIKFVVGAGLLAIGYLLGIR